MNTAQALHRPLKHKEAADLVSAYRRQCGDSYVRGAAVLMKTAYECSGAIEDPAFGVFARLAETPRVDEGTLKLASIVYAAYHRVTSTQEALEKSAGPIAKLWTGLKALGAGAAGLPSFLNTVGLVGVTGGALAGGGLWAANRSINAEDQKTREAEIQRDTYRRLTAEVQNELKRRHLSPTPGNTAAVVDYLT